MSTLNSTVINLVLRPVLGGSIRPLVAQIRSQLQGITSTVNVTINPQAQRQVFQLNNAFNRFNATLTITRATATNAAAAINALATSFGALQTRSGSVNISLTNTGTAMRRVAGGTNLVGAGFERLGEQIFVATKRFGAFVLGTAAIYQVVNAIGGAVKAGIEFDAELIKISQVTGKPKEALAGLADEITRVATTFGVSSKDITQAALILSQAGFSASEVQKSLEALAKTQLAPNFKDMGNTVEGVIAIVQQFDVSLDQIESKLGSVNAVAAAFAVEAEDIIGAVRKSGAVFSTLGGSFEEFISVFSSIRQTTRASADSIANSFKTIFGRIQRPEAIQQLRELGIELLDADGNFVGPLESLKRLKAGLAGTDSRSQTAAQVFELVGGLKQLQNVLPAIQQSGLAEQILQVAKAGTGSLTADQIKAQESLIVKLTQTKEAFLALFRTITQDAAFKGILTGVLGLANAFTKLASVLVPLVPVLATFATIKAIPAIGQIGRGILGRIGIEGFGGFGGIGGGAGGGGGSRGGTLGGFPDPTRPGSLARSVLASVPTQVNGPLSQSQGARRFFGGLNQQELDLTLDALRGAVANQVRQVNRSISVADSHIVAEQAITRAYANNRRVLTQLDSSGRQVIVGLARFQAVINRNTVTQSTFGRVAGRVGNFARDNALGLSAAGAGIAGAAVDIIGGDTRAGRGIEQGLFRGGALALVGGAIGSILGGLAGTVALPGIGTVAGATAGKVAGATIAGGIGFATGVGAGTSSFDEEERRKRQGTIIDRIGGINNAVNEKDFKLNTAEFRNQIGSVFKDIGETSLKEINPGTGLLRSIGDAFSFTGLTSSNEDIITDSQKKRNADLKQFAPVLQRLALDLAQTLKPEEIDSNGVIVDIIEKLKRLGGPAADVAGALREQLAGIKEKKIEDARLAALSKASSDAFRLLSLSVFDATGSLVKFEDALSRFGAETEERFKSFSTISQANQGNIGALSTSIVGARLSNTADPRFATDAQQVLGGIGGPQIGQLIGFSSQFQDLREQFKQALLEEAKTGNANIDKSGPVSTFLNNKSLPEPIREFLAAQVREATDGGKKSLTDAFTAPNIEKTLDTVFNKEVFGRVNEIIKKFGEQVEVVTNKYNQERVALEELINAQKQDQTRLLDLRDQFAVERGLAANPRFGQTLAGARAGLVARQNILSGNNFGSNPTALINNLSNLRAQLAQSEIAVNADPTNLGLRNQNVNIQSAIAANTNALKNLPNAILSLKEVLNRQIEQTKEDINFRKGLTVRALESRGDPQARRELINDLTNANRILGGQINGLNGQQIRSGLNIIGNDPSQQNVLNRLLASTPEGQFFGLGNQLNKLNGQQNGLAAITNQAAQAQQIITQNNVNLSNLAFNNINNLISQTFQLAKDELFKPLADLVKKLVKFADPKAPIIPGFPAIPGIPGFGPAGPTPVPRFHDGGPVGFARGGEVLSLLQGGEFVLNRKAVRVLGSERLARFNRLTGQDGKLGDQARDLLEMDKQITDPESQRYIAREALKLAKQSQRDEILANKFTPQQRQKLLNRQADDLIYKKKIRARNAANSGPAAQRLPGRPLSSITDPISGEKVFFNSRGNRDDFATLTDPFTGDKYDSVGRRTRLSDPVSGRGVPFVGDGFSSVTDPLTGERLTNKGRKNLAINPRTSGIDRDSSFTDPLTGRKVPIIRRAGGGGVPGMGNSDSVHAMLTPGEFVINKNAARTIGYGNLNQMNRMAGGGSVTGGNNQSFVSPKFDSSSIERASLALQKVTDNLGLAASKLENVGKLSGQSIDVKVTHEVDLNIAGLEGLKDLESKFGAIAKNVISPIVDQLNTEITGIYEKSGLNRGASANRSFK